MKRLLIVIAAAVPFPAIATEKSSVTLENGGIVSIGGEGRAKEAGSLSAAGAPLSQVMGYLDDAAGIYFAFSGGGIAVIEESVTE